MLLSAETHPAFRLGGGQGSLGPDEEFVGPMAGWQDVTQTPCNATGNGSTNDAPAIQTCINNLSSTSPVIWFPAHTYKIADISTTATASSGSHTLTVASGAGITIGMATYCAGVPMGNPVTNVVGTTVTISLATTAPLSNTPCLFGLDIRDQQYVSLIGAGPATTTWSWAGSTGGTMLLLSGSTYSAVNRITFEGNGTAGVAIDESNYDTTDANFFDTGDQYADDVFQHGGGTVSYGIRCGNAANGCAETEVVRDTFTGFTVGVATCNANALDMWVWWSIFNNNADAIADSTNAQFGTTTCQSGAYHSIQSNYFGSTAFDWYDSGGLNAILLGNYSNGSAQAAYIGKSYLQDNIIVNTTNSVSLSFRSDELVMLDNAVYTKTGNTAPSVISNGGGHLFAMGNTFNISSAIDPTTFVSYYNVDNAVGSINTAAPELPGTPPNKGRTIFEASVTGSGTVCSAGSPCVPQVAICQASNGPSSTFVSGSCTGSPNLARNVAHLRAGTYTISATLSIPANSNAQIIGDGYYSILQGTSSANPVIMINGPSQIVLRNFQVQATSSTNAIQTASIDQSGAILYMQNQLISGPTTAIYMNSLHNILVEAHDFLYPYATSNALVQSGPNQFNIFLGSTTQSHGTTTTISGGGNNTQAGIWFDSNIIGVTPYASITGGGNVYFLGSSINTLYTDNSGQALGFLFNNFTGNAGVMTQLIHNDCPTISNGTGISITGSGAGNELLTMNEGPSTSYISNTATGNSVEFLNNQISGGCSGSISDTGSAVPTFLRTTLEPLRSNRPIVPHSLPSGTTDIEIYHVYAGTALHAMDIEP